MSTSLLFLFLFPTILCLPEPSEYILSFNKSDNPLNLNIVRPLEKNYIITIGDWGANERSIEDKRVQKAVADIMKSFYESQKAKGMNLLFIAAAGDNFYWTGQNCQEWDTYWRDIYGPNLTSTDVQWLGVYGNHDWADKDEYALCAWNNTKYIEPNTGIPYAANQLNADKGGCNPPNYYIPDFAYYYTMNELNFEMIVLEETASFCPHEIGGGHGNDKVWQNCKEYGKTLEQGKDVGCRYFGKIANASENMLMDRAKVKHGNKEILIMQHYPQKGKALTDIFKANIEGNVNEYDVWSVYGHAHGQQCDRTYNDSNGKVMCDQICSGGGGGCCNFEFTTRGIYVIGFDSNGKMTQPYAFDDERISCTYPCGTMDEEPSGHRKQEMLLDTCCNTIDADIDCDVVDPMQCIIPWF